jgi:hypothetical protein
MSTLIAKQLILKKSNPPQYSLTETGEHLAQLLWITERDKESQRKGIMNEAGLLDKLSPIKSKNNSIINQQENVPKDLKTQFEKDQKSTKEKETKRPPQAPDPYLDMNYNQNWIGDSPVPTKKKVRITPQSSPLSSSINIGSPIANLNEGNNGQDDSILGLALADRLTSQLVQRTSPEGKPSPTTKRLLSDSAACEDIIQISSVNTSFSNSNNRTTLPSPPTLAISIDDIQSNCNDTSKGRNLMEETIPYQTQSNCQPSKGSPGDRQLPLRGK